jgi:hypothetical protein
MRRAVALALILAVCTSNAQTVILYSRKDYEQAIKLRNVTVLYDATFIDRDLYPGENWQKTIAAKILTAKKVLIVWSAASAASKNVAKELEIVAASSATAVAVLLDSTELPIILRDVHAIDWRETTKPPEGG